MLIDLLCQLYNLLLSLSCIIYGNELKNAAVIGLPTYLSIGLLMSICSVQIIPW